MRIKLDENLPFRLVSVLTALGHDVDAGPQEGLQGRTDAEIWDAAQETRRFLVTQDLDFSDMRRFAPGSHFGVRVLRLREPGREALADRLGAVFETEDIESWAGCFVVVTERKIRVRRPSH